MPADIRNFFGGKPSAASAASAESPAKKEATPKGRGRLKKAVIVDDSDDEPLVQPKKATPNAAAKPKKAESPKVTATSTSDYFGTSNKPKRSEAAKAKSTKQIATPQKSAPQPAAAATPNDIRTPIRTKRQTNVKREPDVVDLDNDDDVFKSNFKANVKKDDYEAASDEDMEVAQPTKARTTRAQKNKVTKEEEDFKDVDVMDVDDDDDFVVPDDEDEDVKPKKSRATKVTPKKRKSPPLSDDEDEEEPPKKGRGKKAVSTTKSPAKKKAKKDEPENTATQAIFDSISKVRAPTPPPRDDDKKFSFASLATHKANMSASSTTLDIPQGAENCLAGLRFVFTGVLPNLDRTTGQNLVKQYGGKVQPSASTTTDFVVLGADAGPRKLEVIAEHKLKTIDAEGLVQLIAKMPPNGGSGKAAADYQKKQENEAKKVRKLADEMEAEEKRLAKFKAASAKPTTGAAGRKSSTSGKPAASAKSAQPAPENRLWTVKYAPTQLNQICGNKIQVDRLSNWLRNFAQSKKFKFKKGGKDGMGVYRAVIIHGPPGIGKTTAAHVVAKAEGYDIVESNASDTRSKKLVEEGLKGVLSTTSLNGYFRQGNQSVDSEKRRLVLIMDEVDGMSAGDRGGVGALAKVCTKTEVPMILICNDRKLPKMKPFDHVTFDLPFRRPTVDQIRGRMLTIGYREGLNLPVPVLNALIEGSGADIRQVVNMLSTAKLDQAAMDFDQGKQMSKAWEKHTVLKPWDIATKIMGSAMFAENSKSTLNDKIELYFNDHEFSYLMLQENYLGVMPARANHLSGPEKNLKMLELASEAADSISDGDLVDRMIHGSQQQWSLMPTHAVFSFVRPASYIAGNLAGYGGGGMRFTQWLGNNSKSSKLIRFVKEIQGHMRLRSTGDRHEIRQQYIPSLWESLIHRLQKDGKDAVPEIIELMDSYFLTRDDWDAILELGVGKMDMEKVKIESQTKSTFTRLYNAASHPLPYMKASSVVAPSAKVSRDKPDLEEAIEESDDGGADDVVEVKQEDEDAIDLKKDKYIKAPKKKKAAPAKGKGKKVKCEDEDEEMEEEEEKPKKGKGKAKAKAKK